MARPALLAPLVRQSVEVWSLESTAFLLYGVFMLVAGYVAGQLPVVGMLLVLLLGGPLAAGPVLATNRILLQERPEREDFLGGFHGVRRLAGLALLASVMPVLALCAWLALQGLGLTSGPGLWVAVLLALAILLATATILAVAPQALLLETLGPWRAARRSLGLVRGRWALVALLQILLAATDLLLGLPTLDSLLSGGTPTVMQWLPLLFGEVLLGPFQAILATLLYVRLHEANGGTLARC